MADWKQYIGKEVEDTSKNYLIDTLSATPHKTVGKDYKASDTSEASPNGVTKGSDIYGRSIDSEDSAEEDALNSKPSTASGFLNNLIGSLEVKAKATGSWLKDALNNRAMEIGQALTSEQESTEAVVPFTQPETNVGDTNTGNSLYDLLETQRRVDRLDEQEYSKAVALGRQGDGSFREYYGLSPLGGNTDETPKTRPSGVSRGALDAARNLSAEQANTIVKDANGNYTNQYAMLEKQRAQDRIDERNYADGVKIARSGGFREYYGLKPMENTTPKEDDGETIGEYEARIREEKKAAQEAAAAAQERGKKRTEQERKNGWQEYVSNDIGAYNHNAGLEVFDPIIEQQKIDAMNAEEKKTEFYDNRDEERAAARQQRELQKKADNYTEYVSNDIKPREKSVQEYQAELDEAKKELARADEAAAWDWTDGTETAKAVKAAQDKVYELEQKLFTAQQNEKASQYNAMFKSPSFDNAASDGNSIYDPNADVFRQKDPGNKIRYADDHQDMLNAALADTQKDDYVKVYENLSLATKDERDLYAYILATNGSKAADEFLEYIRPALNARAGKKISDSIEADSGASRIAREIVLGGASGYEQAMTGLKQNFSKDALAQTTYQNANTQQQQNIIAREGDGFSVEKTMVNLSNTMGNMLPAIVAGTLVGPEVANIIAGMSTRGTTYNQLVSAGIAPEAAKRVANVTGAAEAVTGYALSGISQFGGKLTNNAVTKLTDGITNSTAKAFAELGIDTLSEDMEEVLQNKIETWARNQYLGEDGSYSFNQEDLDTVILTTLSTVLMQGTNMATNAIAKASTDSVVNNTNNDGLAVDPRTGQVSELSLAEADAKAYAAEQEAANTPVVEEPAPEYTPQEESPKTDTGMPDMRAEMDDANALISSLNGTNVSNSDAMRIINDPVLTMVFEEQTGIKLEGTNSEKRAQIKNALAETVTEQNTQQTAETETNQQTNETNTENQQTTETTEQTEQNTEKSATDKQDELVNLAFAFNENNVAGAGNLQTAIDGLTSEEVTAIKASLESNTARSQAEDTLLSLLTAKEMSNQQNQQTSENPLTEEENNVNTETPSKPSRHSDSTSTNQENTNNPDNSNLGTDEVQTQSTVHDQYTDEEKQRSELNPENDTHIQHKDTLVDEEATRRVTDNQEQTRSDLMNKNPAEWDDVDVRSAQMILTDELEKARQLTGAEQDAAYKRIAELKNQYNQQGTEAGRSLRQRQRFGGTKEDIVSEAANVLFSEENAEFLRNISPEKKTEIINNVNDYAERLSNIPADNSTDLIQLIKDAAEVRNNKALLDFGNAKLNFALERAAQMDGGLDFLRNLATTQIRSIASDYINPGLINKLKSIRFINMLSAPATAARNVGANTIFGNIMCAVANNTAAPIDAIMSLATGKHTVGFERLSSDQVKGSFEAGLKSWLEVTLDAEAEQSTYAYNEIKGRTFKGTGNIFERFFSALERNQGYQLKTTDQIAKGGTEAETKRNLKNSGLTEEEISEIANQEALYRTLQDSNKVTQFAQDVRRVLDDAVHFGNKKTGEYGLGSDLMPFAQVPANSVRASVQFNPLSGIPALTNIIKVMAKGSNATAMEQHQAAVDFGKSVTGTGLIVGAAAMAAKGLLRYTDADDKDEKQLDKAQRKSGLQINLSAALRMANGEDTAEQSDDYWMQIGWIPQLNSLASTGVKLYDAYNESGEKPDAIDFASASFESIKDAMEEFPAVSTITDIANAYNYANVNEESKVPEFLQRGAAAAATKVANTVTGMAVPNIVRADAAGSDPYERNLYSQENPLLQGWDYIKGGIRGLRETLPTQKDNFGNDITNVGGDLNWLNKMILPGAITQDRESEYLDSLRAFASETEDMSLIPDKKAPTKISYKGVDYELDSDQGDSYVVRRGDEYVNLTNQLFNMPEYQNMDKDLKDAIGRDLMSYATDMAKQEYLDSQGIEYNSAIQKLMDGVDKPGTSNDRVALDPENVVQYYMYKNMYDTATDEDLQTDYATVDKLTKLYDKMPENLKAVVDERFSGFKSVKQMADIGVNSQNYYTLKDSVSYAQEQLDKSSPNGDTNFLGLVNANIPDSVKRNIIENGDYLTKARKSAYDILTPYGYSIADVYDFFDKMDYQYNNETKEGKASGTISALECAVALSKEDRLTEQQKNDIYNAMRSAYSSYFNNWGNYTYKSEVKYAGNQTKYTYGKSSSSRTGSTSSENPLADSAVNNSASTGQLDPRYTSNPLIY